MKITVVLKLVPDVVEELEIDPCGTKLDADSVRLVAGESDLHALEQALLLKEAHSGHVSAMACESDETDQLLFEALAKGADSAARLSCGDPPASTRELARRLACALEKELPDLILTGAQASDDLDGQLAPMLAVRLGLPYVGVVASVTPGPGPAEVTVMKDLAGGERAELIVQLPAVLGVQAAPQPPRYVPVAKVRQTMKTARLETIEVPEDPAMPALEVLRLRKPEPRERAQMLDGDAAQIAAKICTVLTQRGLL